MTREKAIEVLENGAWWDLLIPVTTIEGRKSDIELHEALDIAIAALRNGWISVKDRLPDKPGHYLICTSINYWHGGCMDINNEHKYHESGTPIGYDGTTMSVLDCYYDVTGDWNRVFNCHVTHWMPLPEPPKAELLESER